MKIYNSYQEAKIANQEREIFSLQGKYTYGGDEPLHPDSQGCYWNHCEPSDHLMSVAMFISSGYKICAGDAFIDTDGKVETMTEIDAINNCINDDDNKRYILKSAWVKDKIPTESPQEREALDMIDTTSKQVESLEKGDVVEWDGEGLPTVGVECEKIFDGKSQIVTPLYYDDHKSGMVMFYYRDSGKSVGLDYDWCLVENCIFRKTESPEQKAERERLEAAYDLYCYAKKESVYSCVIVSFKEFIGDFPAREREEYLAIVDKTGYRKESK